VERVLPARQVMVDPKPGAVRVLVVDDHDLVRSSLLRVLADQVDLEPVGDASTLGEARELIVKTHPDIVLLDHVLPDGRGAHEVAGLISLHPAARVVMLTSSGSDSVLCAAVSGGAAGFISKSRGPAPILDAVRAAARGDAAISRELMRRLLFRAGGQVEGPRGRVSEVDVELLVLLSLGVRIDDAAARLGAEPEGVRRRVTSISAELGSRSTLETLLIAVSTGLIPSPT